MCGYVYTRAYYLYVLLYTEKTNEKHEEQGTTYDVGNVQFPFHRNGRETVKLKPSWF